MQHFIRLIRLGLIFAVSLVFVSCGGGGSQSTSTNAVNAVINQSGGQVTLSDGTTATFAAGIVKDGTNVTISSTAQPTSVPTQGVQALTPVVEVDIPPNSFLSSAPSGSNLTIELPLTGNIAGGVSTTNILGSVGEIVQVTLADIGGHVANYYSQLTSNALGSAVVSIGIDHLCDTSSAVCDVVKVSVAAMNAIQCTQQTTSLYQVNFRNGTSQFDTNIVLNGKPPLILVHGWQELGIIEMQCDKPYSSTWTEFLKEYELDPTISDKFQIFSLAYSTSNPISGDLGVGSQFAQIIKSHFGQDDVYVVAHSMGGLVARTALVDYGATNIQGLITLATPHHGTPLASQEGVSLFAGTPLYPIIDYAMGGQGIMDLGWDNFDGFQPPFHSMRSTSSNPILGNPFLEALNAQDTYRGRYVVFAGQTKDLISSVLQSLQYDNDWVVPIKSGLFYQIATTSDSSILQQKEYAGLNHLNITNDAGVLSDTRAALLGLLNVANLPTIPTGVSATAGDGQATISWDTVTGVTYNVYMASVTGVTKSNYSSLADGAFFSGVTSPFTLTALSNGKTYYFVVIAVNGYGESGESSEVSATPQAVADARGDLNDTGITSAQCYQAGSDTLVDCSSDGAIQLNNAQDGMVGRDANLSTNKNTDGKLGFSFSAVPGGCVQDNVTGLMWEIKTTDGGLRDWNKTYTNYFTGYDPVKGYETASDASGFVNAVNATNLCGFSDWRLPTIDELQSIVDYSVAFPGPTIDTTWFPNTPQGIRYWSASPNSYIGGAWAVIFFDGSIIPHVRDSTLAIRLVRGGNSALLNRYSVSADGQEVTDNQSNLIWRRCVEGMVFSSGTCTGTASTFTQEAALQHAAAETSGTGFDWRLPNVKELSSIVDKDLIGPMIDPTAFPETPANWFWSASPGVSASGYSWGVNFNDGFVFNGDDSPVGVVGVSFLRNVGNYVRLVRDAIPSGLPIVRFSASPSYSIGASTFVFNWTSTNSTSCTSSGGGGTGTEGSFTSPILYDTTTYIVTCSGPDGISSQSTTVEVIYPRQ